MSPESILIVGANGQLGTALRQQYPEAQAADSSELDVTDPIAVQNFDWSGITVVINAAAYTNVDGAESHEGRKAAWQVNAVGVRNLAKAAIDHDLTLFHVSTEYVFDGTQTPHSEDEPLSPLGVYADTKAAGDIIASLAPKHYILRTSWLIGEGKNFVRIMLSLGEKGIAPSVVSDQVGRLTFTSELVRVVEHFLSTTPDYGTYNVSNGGDTTSWADVARATFELAGYDLQVTDTTTKQYFADKPEASARPLNSLMDLRKLEATGFTPRDWKADLQAYITKEQNV